MEKFEVNSVQVSTLLSYVKDGTIAIPEIQRPLYGILQKLEI